MTKTPQQTLSWNSMGANEFYPFLNAQFTNKASEIQQIRAVSVQIEKTGCRSISRRSVACLFYLGRPKVDWKTWFQLFSWDKPWKSIQMWFITHWMATDWLNSLIASYRITHWVHFTLLSKVIWFSTKMWSNKKKRIFPRNLNKNAIQRRISRLASPSELWDVWIPSSWFDLWFVRYR